MMTKLGNIAITCNAGGGNRYFRQTCGSGNNPTLARDKCRCKNKKVTNDTDQVPTYFDYVPQYLRWFEEWAEDFCRLRKHKLKDAIKKCRGDNGTERYCDLNRHDCTKTASGKHDFFEGDDCIGCHFSCSHFVKWIDNQKLEFLKQKKKCRNEIPSSKRQKRSIRSGSDGNKYDGYESKFYDKLQSNGYGTVNKFLQLLNNEKACKDIKDDKEGTIDFKTVKSSSTSGDDSNKTFDHTEYCQACPWCGAEK
ncbi:pfEMP1, partial [Plasmodium falciparum HB3]